MTDSRYCRPRRAYQSDPARRSLHPAMLRRCARCTSGSDRPQRRTEALRICRQRHRKLPPTRLPNTAVNRHYELQTSAATELQWRLETSVRDMLGNVGHDKSVWWRRVVWLRGRSRWEIVRDIWSEPRDNSWLCSTT